MKENPYITGIGLIKPLGDSAEETWRALLAGEFIRDHAANFHCIGNRSNQSYGSCGIAGSCLPVLAGRRNASPIHPRPLVIGTSKGPIEKFLSAGALCDFGLAELARSTARELEFGAGPRCTLSAACAADCTR